MAEIKRQNSGLQFWPAAGLIMILLVSIMGRNIGQPFMGLHSWGAASGAWAARSHVNYGLDYTRGMSTWAVGDPPTENPQRYLSHPQLAVLAQAGFMAVFGVSEATNRIYRIVITLAAFFFLLKILRTLFDDRTALLAAAIFVLFPLTGYFGAGGASALFGLAAVYFYLVNMGELKRPPKKWEKIALGASLFMAIQFGWPGFFYATALGIHYLGYSLIKRKKPSIKFACILALPPAASLLVNFMFMAHGFGWDTGKIVELFRWRASLGEMQHLESFDWPLWFGQLWEYAVTNFTIPAIFLAGLYIVFGQLVVYLESRPDEETGRRPRQFPYISIFILVPFFQLFLLRGALWRHQTWLTPLGPVIAISAALAVMMVFDIISKLNRRTALVAVLAIMGVYLGFAIAGVNYYFAVRWQPIEKIRMFQMLNEKIEPHEALLSFEPFVVDQHSSKGDFYRPEIAWYLDREIERARSLQDIMEKAQTGRYPYYLIPMHPQLNGLITQLAGRFEYQQIPAVSGERTDDGKFLRAGMPGYLIFDLRSPRQPNPVIAR